MPEEKQWKRIAQRTAHKINLGWWLQILSTPMLIASLLIACAILITRREFDATPWLVIMAVCTGLLSLLSLSTWFIARPRFESQKQSLVRIEASMRLRNALTAADHGIAPWPKVPDTINDGVRWHWKRLISVFSSAILIILCGFLIPIQAKSDTTIAQQEPTAWSELDNSIDQLDNQEIVQKEYLDEMRKKLEKLREQSEDDWFSHSSLEATDNLKRNHLNEQENLKKNLERAERNLNTLQNQASKLNAQQKQQLLKEFDQAVKKMQQSGMKPNKELMEQLKKLDPNQLNQLTPEQIDQLRESMRRHAQGLQPP